MQQVTDLDHLALSATAGALLAIFSFSIPFIIVIHALGMARAARHLAGGLGGGPVVRDSAISSSPPITVPGWRRQIAGISCIAALVVLLRFWRPRELCRSMAKANWCLPSKPAASARQPIRLGGFLMPGFPGGCSPSYPYLGVPQFQSVLVKLFTAEIKMPWLHNLARRMPPIDLANAAPIKAIFKLHVLSATGTGIFLAAIIIGFVIGYSPREWIKTYLETIWRIRLSLLTMAAMLALGNVTRYSGTDGTLGLAFAHTGRFYPFFGTLLGGSAQPSPGRIPRSNVLFGSLQKITAQQIGISAVLMCAPIPAVG